MVPVVFCVTDRSVVVPIDTVKRKRGTVLQRELNLASDARCSVLVDEYDDDWSRLWWVRAHGRGVVAEVGPYVPLLAARWSAYGEAGAVRAVIVITVSSITGWAASGDDPRGSNEGPTRRASPPLRDSGTATS